MSPALGESLRYEEEISKSMADADLNKQAVAEQAAPPTHEEAQSMFSMAAVREYVGADVVSLLSVPVFIMEPMSMLQKMAEIMECAELLDQAAKAEDPVERMALIAAFYMSPFGSCERAWKPFNPLLGETFEAEGLGPEKDARFLAEQVTHTPPVGVAHAENPKWEYDIVSAPKTHFLGNSLEVYPNCRSRIRLRTTNETYAHVPPHVKVHNLVLGRTWIDVEGEFYICCRDNGIRCDLTFTPCGWFNAGRYEFSGYITERDGTKRMKLTGLWSSHLDVAVCGPDGTPSESPRRLWTCAPKPTDDHYGMGEFAKMLNTCTGLRVPPLPSDSRRRPDREALAGRHMPKAASEKSRLEEALRVERMHREKGAGPEWVPHWFEEDTGDLLPGELGDVPMWRWRAGGFDRLDKQLEAAADSHGVEDCKVCGHGFAPWQFPELH